MGIGGRTAIGIGIGVVALLALEACTAKDRIREARSALRTNDLATARQLLEADRQRRPSSVPVRLALGEVYYRSARDALDWDDDEGRYLAYLERSLDEFVVSARLAPEHQQPHFYMAVIDVYRGDLEAAMRGLRNARRLAPGPIADTNLAETFVYAGDLAQARRWNESGRLAGAGLGAVTFNEMLIHWSEGDLVAAREDFAFLRAQYPKTLRTINVAPLPTMPQRFEEFAGYCCESPACGPYLEHACTSLGLAVTRREVSEETLLRELQLEMESRRRLREIYGQRKELELEVGEETFPE